MAKLILIFTVITVFLTIDNFPTSGVLGDVAHYLSKSILLTAEVFVLFLYGKVYSLQLYKLRPKWLYTRIFEHLILPSVCIIMTGMLFRNNPDYVILNSIFYFVVFVLMVDIDNSMRDYLQAREKDILGDVEDQPQGNQIFIYGVIFYCLALLFIL